LPSARHRPGPGVAHRRRPAGGDRAGAGDCGVLAVMQASTALETNTLCNCQLTICNLQLSIPGLAAARHCKLTIDNCKLTIAVVLLSSSLLSAAGEARPKPAVTALAFAPAQDGFVHASQAGVAYQSLAGGKEKRVLATKLDHIHALAFSPDGTMLAIGGGSPAESGAVELWSWPAGKLLGKLEGHTDVVYDAVWLPGNRLASA